VAVISVRGTIFDIVVGDDDSTYVSVDEGRVAVFNRTTGGEERLLNPGEEIRVYPNVPLAKRVDRGTVVQAVLRSAREAILQAIYSTPRSGGGAGSVPTGTPLPGDSKGKNPTPPPPATPPPPPPPPPPPGFLPAGAIIPLGADTRVPDERAIRIAWQAAQRIF
jgi:hypothetical protein